MTLKFLSPSEHVASSVTYVRDQDGQVYARVPVYTAYDSSTVAGSKVVSIHGPEFAMWINDTVRRQGQGSVPKSFVKDVVNTAELIASYNSVKQETCVRVGKVGDSYYIDMGDDTGRAIKVEPGKWSIVPSAPIMFVRSPNDEPMREPLAPGQGNVNDLFKVVNVAPADHNFLIVWPMLSSVKASPLGSLTARLIGRA